MFHSDLLLRRQISFSPPQPPSPPPATFRAALLQPETTDFEAHEADLHTGGNLAGKQQRTRRHMPPSSSSLLSTRRRVRARGSFYGDVTPHTRSSDAVLLLYPSNGPPRAPSSTFLPFLPPPPSVSRLLHGLGPLFLHLQFHNRDFKFHSRDFKLHSSDSPSY